MDPCLKRIKPLPTVWNEIRKNHLFSDVTIESSDHKIYHVHRVILAASSEYFRCFFVNPARILKHEIQLDFPSSIIDSFLDFCYTGKCTVNAENVVSLLAGAMETGLCEIVSLCCVFLQDNLNIKNCWKTYLLCKTYYCEKIANYAWHYTVIHFMEFFQEKDTFLSLSKDDLACLLSDSYLNVREEEQVFLAVDEWIKHDLVERESYATDLLMCVRINLVSSIYYEQTILKAPYMEKVQPNILNNMDKMVSCSKKRPWKLLNSAPFWPRIPYEIVFIIGGWHESRISYPLETYDIRANSWCTSSLNDWFPRAFHGLVCVNNCIYIIGGLFKDLYLSTLRCFDPATGVWFEKSCMHYARGHLCSVYLDGYIYAIGGYDGINRMNFVEKYDISTNQWEEVTPMFNARSGAGAAVCKNKIYVVGGYDGHSILASTEVYDPVLQTWTVINAHMNEPRTELGVVQFKDCIYAIGGFNGFSRLKCMEKYNPSRNQWDNDLPDMKLRRSDLSCTVVEDVILVVGGYNGKLHRLTECFNGNSWNSYSLMRFFRSGAAICTISGLRNACQYSLAGNYQRNKDDSFRQNFRRIKRRRIGNIYT